MNLEQLIKELDRYYLQIISLIERKKEYSELNYKSVKGFYDYKIKSIRNKISKSYKNKLEEYDNERGFLKERYTTHNEVITHDYSLFS